MPAGPDRVFVLPIAVDLVVDDGCGGPTSCDSIQARWLSGLRNGLLCS